MKRFVLILMFLLCLGTTYGSSGKLTKEQISFIEYQSQLYEKEGWKMLSGGSIREGMIILSEMIATQKYIEVSGISLNKPSLDSALYSASCLALMTLAEKIDSGVCLQSSTETSFNSIFKLNLNMLPIPIIVLYRDLKDGTYDCSIHYLLNKDVINNSQLFDDNHELTIIIEGSYNYEDNEE